MTQRCTGRGCGEAESSRRQTHRQCGMGPFLWREGIERLCTEGQNDQGVVIRGAEEREAALGLQQKALASML